MKPRTINEIEEWTFILPDSIADWDAPSHWERARCQSMWSILKPGMTLYDVGSEHGWLSALYGTFVGHENMVLIEPSPEFWVNIHKTWVANGFADPAYCWPGFVADESDGPPWISGSDWPSFADVDAPEIGGMAYRYLGGEHPIPRITIDDLVSLSGIVPDAITMDIEGAELVAMRGAARTLRTYRPIVWISIHPDLMERDFGHTKRELKEFMMGCGYDADLLEIDHEEHWLFRPVAR